MLFSFPTTVILVFSPCFFFLCPYSPLLLCPFCFLSLLYFPPLSAPLRNPIFVLRLGPDMFPSSTLFLYVHLCVIKNSVENNKFTVCISIVLASVPNMLHPIQLSANGQYKHCHSSSRTLSVYRTNPPVQNLKTCLALSWFVVLTYHVDGTL